MNCQPSTDKRQPARDRVIIYAIAISIVVHLMVAVVVGRSWAARLARPAVASVPRFIKVDLIEEPRPEEKPVKVSVPKVLPKPILPEPVRVRHLDDLPSPKPVRPVAVRPVADPARVVQSATVPGNPGSSLNTGSRSSHGDIPDGPASGSTPVGHVPGSGDGPGVGSGTGPGVAPPDPPKNPVDEGPGTRPAPAPPPPRMVTVQVCSESGMLPGKHCEKKTSRTYVEGNEPTRACNVCKEPFRSTLADRAEPTLIRDAKPSIPGSVEEGLSVTVTVVFTIDERGNVSNVQVTKTSGNKAIDRAVTDAVSKRKYEPAVQGGIPRSVKRSKTYSINT